MNYLMLYRVQLSSMVNQGCTSQTEEMVGCADSIVAYILQFLNYLDGNADNWFTVAAKEIREECNNDLPQQYAHLQSPYRRYNDSFAGTIGTLQSIQRLRNNVPVPSPQNSAQEWSVSM